MAGKLVRNPKLSGMLTTKSNLLFEALVEMDDVFLAQLLEHFDLSHGGFLDDFVVI